MPARSSGARKPARISNINVAVALFTPRDGALAVLLVPAARSVRSRDRWSLPSDALLADETLDEAATRIARGVLGAVPSMLDQAYTKAETRGAHPGHLTITYFGLAPESGSAASSAGSWIPANDVSPSGAKLSEEIEVALSAMRARVDLQPIAFKLLPAAFTLSELQSVYELLLGRRLHKASFRRSLHASALVEATDEWRSEGRGRPAQLFRYSPPRRRRRRRGIRFDLLG